MWCKKTAWFWKPGLLAISMTLTGIASGCGDMPTTEVSAVQKEGEARTLRENPQENTAQASGENRQEDIEVIIEVFEDFYKASAQESGAADLERIRGIVKKLGQKGYPAVDSENQINMTEAERVIGFCKSVETKAEDKITIIEVVTRTAFTKYDLHTKDGKVDVTRSYYQCENGTAQLKDKGSYQVEYWNYTEDGYLLFSGVYFSEEQYVLTLSGAEEHLAFRVLPLDERCRELNRKYLMPIGYARNNLFLVDWREDNFGSVDFYDLYDILYPKVNGWNSPYIMDDNLQVGAVYRIPKNEFERVIGTCFRIDSETLQSKTVYDSESETYEYKPRGFYDGEYPEHPYPEVVAFTENRDKTITLTVHAVFPYEGISRVYAHEVVVRPLGDGGVQYVSNRVIPSEANYEKTWYKPRLSEKEWEEIYGGR